MEDFWRPVIQDEYSSVRQLAIEANNFELKPALITMVQQHQYIGHPSEDSNEHMGRFFLPALTLERRGEVIVFKQGGDESLYTAWERFKRLLKRCPMHDIDLTTQMDIFYHSMNYTYKGIIDAACCGAFKRKSAEEARQLIEDLTKCNYRAPSETSGSSSRLKGSGGDRDE